MLSLAQNFYYQLVTNWIAFGTGALVPGSFVKQPVTAGVAEALSASPLLVIGAILIARKNETTLNAGEVRIGDSANTYIPLKPGDQYVIGPTAGYRFDLSQWWVKADSVYDGLLVSYIR